LGGGSSDAAAALRLLARANRLSLEDPRLIEAAQVTGADVMVCLDPQTRVMRGIGDVLSDRIKLAPLRAILVNPGVMVATGEVFRAVEQNRHAAKVAGLPLSSWPQGAWVGCASGLTALAAGLASLGNDLEKPAIRLRPVIADVLRALAVLPGCQLSRMTGSGATCFGLFATVREASLAARRLRAEHPTWWIRATTLGSG
jgi:4-diphosphocytidyl-2-C-methyl-D-erythritol kinase